MKSFGIWFALAVAVFGALSGVYHLHVTSHPHLVLVAVDSSFSMQPTWSRVAEQLERFTRRRYTRFSLITEKTMIHGWMNDLRLGKVVPYAPRDFSKLRDRSAYPELSDADEKYLLTDTQGAQEAGLQDWTIIKLTP
ncbi:hypothetical protein CSB45_09405 [candidate division KSB3 bacterium]|uniref:VWA domain-containing protein n=1 Tax=candidate division KSB3 bacterium TaxID=2044937 RepID=A0A2G6E4Q4_9BACT|nr:MAG: hypothetical protein CSB45_09405 [candidate division KSB3 bacterium]PIE29459.1 MAG: hypothetical protein CSA57_08670 [candidate division KSB3 bacterium]